MLQNLSGSIVLLGIGAMMLCCDAWTTSPQAAVLASRHNLMKTICPVRRSFSQTNMIGTGFSFEDGEQILVSVQKPFGIVLEQGSDDGEDNRIVVTEVDPKGSAGKAGIRKGDILVAVQNASTISADLSEVLTFISEKCPRVVNLRFDRSG